LPELIAANSDSDTNIGNDDAICKANTLSNTESIAEGEMNITKRKTAIIVKCVFIIFLSFFYFYDNLPLLEEKEKNSEFCFVALRVYQLK